MALKQLKPEQWFEVIDEGLRFRHQYGLEDSWASNEALFYNVHKSNAHQGPNIVASTGDALLSTLIVPDPHFLVKPRRPGTTEGARVVESVDNTLVADLGMREEVQQGVLDSYLMGVGFLKIGYDSEWGWEPEGMMGELGMSMSQFDRQGRRIEYFVKPGMPWVQAVPPHDIVVPWGVQDIDKSPWIAHRTVRHIEEIKADRKYTAHKDLKPTMSMEDFVLSYQSPQRAKRASLTYGLGRGTGRLEFVELWEIYDQTRGKILTLATGHDKFLRNVDDLLSLSGPPFVSIRFNPKNRSLWTTSDAFYLRQAQAELSDISLQATKQRRLRTLKFIADESAFEPSELMKLISPEVGAMAMKKQGFPMSEAFQAVQGGENFSTHQESEIVRRNAREAVGFSRNQFGEFEQSGRRTASEAMIVDRSSQMRMTRRQLAVRTAYIETIQKINQLIFEYWRTPRIVSVVGEEGTEVWVRYNGPGIRGEYSYNVAFSSEPVETPQQRKNGALQTYMMMAQDPTVDPVQLRRYLVHAFNDPEFSSIFRPEILEGTGYAGLQLQMQGMQGGGRGAAGGQQPQRLPQMQPVQRGDGEGSAI